MARLQLTYGTLDLNDGTTWVLRPGFDPGVPALDFDEHRGWDGSIRQLNVSEASLIEMTVPLLVKGTSLADLYASVDELNTLIEAGEQELTFEGVVYSCAQCPRVGIVFDDVALTTHCAFIDWSPLRYPGEDVGS